MSKRRGNQQNGQQNGAEQYRMAGGSPTYPKPPHDAFDNTDRRDPARGFQNVPPNMGREVLPHIYTFQGLLSTIAKTYRNPDEAIKHSLDNARYMRNDIGIMECLEQRQRAVALLDWHVEVDGPEMPHHKALQERLTRILKSTPRFTEYRRWLLEAIWFGRVGIQHRYGYKFRENGERDLIVAEWSPIQGDKLCFRQDDGSNEHPRGEVGIRVSPMQGATDMLQGRRLVPTENGMATFLAPFERNLICIHKHMIEDAAYEDPLSNGSIHGIGVRSRIYWEWFQKQELLALFIEYLERSALGFEIWYYDSSNPANLAKTKEAAENRIGRKNIILFPRTPGDDTHSDGVERFEPNASGAEAFQNVLNNYFGHRIKRYILGQILTSEVEGTGLGSGVADLHLQTMLDIVKYDATNLEETVTREKLEQIKILNCPGAQNVDTRFVIQTQNPDVEGKLKSMQAAWEMGARLKETDVMEAIGAAIPGPQDIVLQKDGGQQPGQPGGFGDPNSNPVQVSMQELGNKLKHALGGGGDEQQDDTTGNAGGGSGGGNPFGQGGGSKPKAAPPKSGGDFGKGGDVERNNRERYGFNESDHPRDDGGKFSTSGSGGGGDDSPTEKPAARKPAKSRTRMTITQADAALREIGYSIEGGMPTSAADGFKAHYRVKRPDGKLVIASADEIFALLEKHQGGTKERFARAYSDLHCERYGNFNESDHPRDSDGKFRKTAEMSLKEFHQQEKAKDDYDPEWTNHQYKAAVKKAIESGESIHPDALADLPELKGLAEKGKPADKSSDKPADDDDSFQLKNDDKKSKPEAFEDKVGKQKKLFAGMDALPGQENLFDTDGETDGELDSKSDSDDTPASVATGPTPFESDNPRETAADIDSDQQKSEYAFARESSVANAGEDLLGSARHKRNAWRGLADAEQNGTAAELVTRDNLIKNEPPEFSSRLNSTNALSTLAAHVALQRFPAKPEYGRTTDDEMKAAYRKQYYDAYSELKEVAEQASQEEIDPRAVTKKINAAVISKINYLREHGEGDPSRGRSNPIANQLVSMHRAVRPSYGRPSATSVEGRLQDFVGRVQQKYGEASRETLDKIKDHVADVLEGESYNKTFGTESDSGKDVFNPADMYVKHAERKGGRTVDANTAASATKYMTSGKLGMRGVQFGNSVTDDERQHHLQKTAEAFADLADITGFSDEFMSINGKLGIAFGARGHGTASAHYEPTNKIINLTRKSGVGALGHEWGHFLDNILAGGGSESYASEMTWENHFEKQPDGSFKRIDHKGDPVWDAYESWRGTVGGSGFSRRLNESLREHRRKGMSQKKAEYWRSTREVFARSFERYVQRKLEKQGRSNTYLSGLADSSNQDSLWPNDAEVDAMAPAFESIMSAVKNRNEKERYRRDRYRSTREDEGGGGLHWVTIGGSPDGDSEHAGGTRILIDGSGNIHAGPKAFAGKNVSELGGHGDDGDDDAGASFNPSEFKPSKPPLDVNNRFHSELLKTAADWRVDPHDLKETAEYVWDEKNQIAIERETAKKSARERTGLTQLDIDRLENSGMDFTAGRKAGGVTGEKLRHFDAFAQEIAREHPELGLGDPDDKGADFGSALWQVLAEGKRDLPAKHDPEIVREAAKLLRSGRQHLFNPHSETVPFAKRGLVARYVARKYRPDWRYASDRSGQNALT